MNDDMNGGKQMFIQSTKDVIGKDHHKQVDTLKVLSWYTCYKHINNKNPSQSHLSHCISRLVLFRQNKIQKSNSYQNMWLLIHTHLIVPVLLQTSFWIWITENNWQCFSLTNVESPELGCLMHSPGGGGTPSCGLNGDVRPDRVWFSEGFVLSEGIIFIN